MRFRRKQDVPAPVEQASSKPPWAHMLDEEERPNREDLAAGHNVFLDSMLAPVPLPRWLRGRRRQRDKLS